MAPPPPPPPPDGGSGHGSKSLFLNIPQQGNGGEDENFDGVEFDAQEFMAAFNLHNRLPVEQRFRALLGFHAVQFTEGEFTAFWNDSPLSHADDSVEFTEQHLVEFTEHRQLDLFHLQILQDVGRLFGEEGESESEFDSESDWGLGRLFGESGTESEFEKEGEAS